jgi:competence protein ComEA
MSPGKAFLLGEPLDLNRAGLWDLTLLPGVGPVTARKIIADRKARGPFGVPQDLARIPGIPARTLKKIMPLVTTTPLVRAVTAGG